MGYGFKVAVLVSITVLISFNCTGFQYYIKENKKIRGSKAAKVVKNQS